MNTLEERSHRYDKQTNGVVEKGIQEVEDLIRVHKASLEEKLGGAIPMSHPILAWMVPHCADLKNKLEVGKDGTEKDVVAGGAGGAGAAGGGK